MSEPAPSPFVAVPVDGAWDETSSLRALRLELGALGASHTGPGQVLRVRAEGGEGYFALSSAPRPGGQVELLLKRGAPVADEIIAAAQPGRTLEVTAPFGKGFPIDQAEGHDLLLFAAGSGISPIRSLVQHLLTHRARFHRVALFYGQRGHEGFAYSKEHKSWEHGGVHVVLVSSQAPEDWHGARGYVQDVAKELRFLYFDLQRSTAFLCGMKAMVAGVKDVLAKAGVPPERTFLNF